MRVFMIKNVQSCKNCIQYVHCKKTMHDQPPVLKIKEKLCNNGRQKVKTKKRVPETKSIIGSSNENVANSMTTESYQSSPSDLIQSSMFCALRCEQKRLKSCCASHGGKGDEGGSSIQKLFRPIHGKHEHSGVKITVVGSGQVGMAAVVSLLTQGVTNNVAIVDLNEDKLKGEKMDLQHGSAFLKNAIIKASSDYAVSDGSLICIITAGVRQKKGQTRLDIVQNNAEVIKNIVTQLLKHCPKAIFILASNPVDVLSYVTWKVTGIPVQRVIGSGTNLDVARFRYMLSKKLGIATTSIQANIIGEHGNSMVPVWSGVNVAGVRLVDLNPKVGTDSDPENWKDIITRVVQAGAEVRGLKGCTSWAIGLSLVEIANAVLTNSNSVHSVSTNVKGEHGIEDDVFLSLPCVIGRGGVTKIVRQPLREDEHLLLKKSAEILLKVQQGVKM